MADVEPMPGGYAGAITIEQPHAIFSPGVALLAYVCNETETVFGQVLHARYHAVDTWLYRNGTWQIAASQTMRYYEDPAIGISDPAHLDDFIGVYELSLRNRRTVSWAVTTFSFNVEQARGPSCCPNLVTCSSGLGWKVAFCSIEMPRAK